MHNMAFKIGKICYFLKVNQFSDYTANELRQLSAGFTMDDLPVAPSIMDSDGQHQDDVDDEEPTIGLDLADLQRELARVIEQQQPGYEILAHELRLKIDQHPETKSGLSPNLDDELGSASDSPAPKESYKFVRRVPTTNEHYQPVEMISQMSAGSSDDPNWLAMDLVNALNQMPQVKFIREQLSRVFGPDPNNKAKQDEENSSSRSIITSSRFAGKQELDNPRKDQDSNKDTIFIDWRNSNCLTVPKHQEYCRACYAFATMAMLEWAHCNQTGKLVPFSEQYMIDCGKHTNLNGCNGGNMVGMATFIMDWGIELRYNYPYLAKESTCPYEKKDWERAGFLKPVVKNFIMEQDMAKWPRLLKEYGPFIVIIMQPKDFYFYGGKVHKGHNCKETHGIHAMLLVGHGRENGQEYWIFRNSYGYKWGDSGHFKLARYPTTSCYFQANLAKVDFVEKVPSTDKFITVDDAGKRKLTPSEAYLKGLFKGHGPYQLERAKYLAYQGRKSG